jgi:uncharacterized phage protein gp47/JayE
MTAGLTPIGFTAKTVAEIIAELQQAQRSTIDGTLNTSSTGVLANLNMSFAMQLAAVWELLAEIYDAHDPATAEGVALDHNGALLGIPRLPASKAIVQLRLELAALTMVPTGSVVSDPLRPTVRFVTTADSLTSAIGGYVYVAAAAETAGQLIAPAETLTKIESPVSGWTSVTNPAAAIPGTDVETDEAYRLRQQQLRASTEGSTLLGIIADVRRLPGVVTAAGYENVTDTVDANGLPPHSFEIIASGGTDSVIAATIWANKPAGIETYGSTSVSVTDSEGVAHTVRFSRPTLKVINVNYRATVTSNYVPQAIRSALQIASIDPASPMHFAIGQPVYLVRMLKVADDQAIGVVNVSLDATIAPALPADAVPTAPDNTLTMGPRDLPTLIGANWVGP